MSKINKSFKKFIKNVLDLMRKPVMSVLPGQLSFFLLLSLIPIVLMLGLLAPILNVSTQSIISIITASFPSDTSSLIIPLLEEKTLSYSTIFIIVSAILLVSKGTRSIMRVASIIYKNEKNATIKSEIKSIIKSIIMAFILILLITFIIVIPVFSSRIIDELTTFDLISPISKNILFIYKILKWPISIFIIYVNIKIIYVVSPDKMLKTSQVRKGAIFTTFFWTVLTLLYSFYINNISSYSTYYGSASKLIVLMLWIYLISYIFVLGMSISANINKDE